MKSRNVNNLTTVIQGWENKLFESLVIALERMQKPVDTKVGNHRLNFNI